MDPPNQKPLEIHLVTTTDSPEFTHLTRSLTQTSLVGLDAEWKPVRTHQTSFPTVSLLQIACQLDNESVVFLLDLISLPLSSLWESLKEMLVSPHILKLGFRFKQDLVYLSSTFCSQGCNPGFDKVRIQFNSIHFFCFVFSRENAFLDFLFVMIYGYGELWIG
jgi:hypothetical protein